MFLVYFLFRSFNTTAHTGGTKFRLTMISLLLTNPHQFMFYGGNKRIKGLNDMALRLKI